MPRVFIPVCNSIWEQVSDARSQSPCPGSGNSSNKIVFTSQLILVISLGVSYDSFVQ